MTNEIKSKINNRKLTSDELTNAYLNILASENTSSKPKEVPLEILRKFVDDVLTFNTYIKGINNSWRNGVTPMILTAYNTAEGNYTEKILVKQPVLAYIGSYLVGHVNAIQTNYFLDALIKNNLTLFDHIQQYVSNNRPFDKIEQIDDSCYPLLNDYLKNGMYDTIRKSMLDYLSEKFKEESKAVPIILSKPYFDFYTKEFIGFKNRLTKDPFFSDIEKENILFEKLLETFIDMIPNRFAYRDGEGEVSVGDLISFIMTQLKEDNGRFSIYNYFYKQKKYKINLINMYEYLEGLELKNIYYDSIMKNIKELVLIYNIYEIRVSNAYWIFVHGPKYLSSNTDSNMIPHNNKDAALKFYVNPNFMGGTSSNLWTSAKVVDIDKSYNIYYYFINGRAVEPDFFNKVLSGNITFKEFTGRTLNEESRAVIYEILGDEKILKLLNAEVVNISTIKHPDGTTETMELYRTFVSPILSWLKITCPSTGTNYLLPTENDFKTAAEAAKYHRPDFIESKIEYLWNQRN